MCTRINCSFKHTIWKKKNNMEDCYLTVETALQASLEEAAEAPVSSSSWTAVANKGTLNNKSKEKKSVYTTLYCTTLYCFLSHSPPFSLLRIRQTHRWFSLLGPNESLMSLCRWMARWGILKIGRWMCTRRCTNLSPLCAHKNKNQLLEL